ncbi:MAG: hypothetical protein K1563_17005 [Candidatus Thiodiazotropha sp. (ex. Lucinisca nassula)]|nr:hypothetical protein [Candidatus Thiodiazotropha sp. (ex. Lucinisca nassula)]
MNKLTHFLLVLVLGLASISLTASATELSKMDKASAVLQSIQSGDATAMEEYVNQDKYIQHNLAFPDGIAPVIGAVKSGMFKGTLVTTLRTITDGDFVVLQSLYSGSWNNLEPQVIIDVFRFEKDLIVEHWDNIMPLASKPNPSGNTQLDGIIETIDLEKTAANKTLAKSYIDTVLVKGEIDKIHYFVEGDNYIQHHPDIANGVSGLKAALGAFAKQGIVMEYDQIHDVHGQGNFVLVMSSGKFGDKPFAYFDLLGLQDNKVNQHWGIMAPIAPKSEWKNTNGKF